MKKLFIYGGMLLAVLTAGFSSAKAQDDATTTTVAATVPEVSMIGVAGSAVSLTFATPSSAGEGFANVTSTDASLVYTSVVGADVTNQITASLESELPSGLNLKVEAGVDAGNGDGTQGTATTGGLDLSTTSSVLVSAIGSAYTGTTSDDGRPLTYTLSVNDGEFENLVADSYSINVVYTISAETIE